MYWLIRKSLFLLPAETAHNLVMNTLLWLFKFVWFRKLFGYIYRPKKQVEKTIQFGITFPNRLGLAAGFDKDAKYLEIFETLGFGFVEIGTVTPLPQEGNLKPRLFRLPQHQALINRMGFNGDGLDAVAQRLQKRPQGLIVGANIGKNKTTPNERAHEDYIKCFEKLVDLVDYFVVNVSSPNTVGLRELQERRSLKKILNSLQDINLIREKPKPILLKISPDLTESQISDIIDVTEECRIQGIVATNTTISRVGVRGIEYQSGGLSGNPLEGKSNQIIRNLRSKGHHYCIIGVGGVDDLESFNQKLRSGADLVQIYTGFVYKGPSVVKQILG